MSAVVPSSAQGLSPGREKLLRLEINSRMAHGAYSALSEWRIDLVAEYKRLVAEATEEERRGGFSTPPLSVPRSGANNMSQHQLDQHMQFAEKRKAAIASQIARAKQELDTVTDAMEKHSEIHRGQNAVAQRLREHLDKTETRPMEYL